MKKHTYLAGLRDLIMDPSQEDSDEGGEKLLQ